MHSIFRISHNLNVFELSNDTTAAELGIDSIAITGAAWPSNVANGLPVTSDTRNSI